MRAESEHDSSLSGTCAGDSSSAGGCDVRVVSAGIRDGSRDGFERVWSPGSIRVYHGRTRAKLNSGLERVCEQPGAGRKNATGFL